MAKREPNRGSFRPGYDVRRHVFTPEERRRGGLSCAAKYTVCGRWHLDWHDRCGRRVKTEGGYSDGPQEEGDADGHRNERDGGGGGPAGADGIPY